MRLALILGTAALFVYVWADEGFRAACRELKTLD